MNVLRNDAPRGRLFVDAVAGITCAALLGTTAAADDVFPLVPVPGLTENTGEKPQSKVWQHAGTWWACLPSNAVSPSGTWIWRLEPGDTWAPVLQVSLSTSVKADVLPLGDVAHILLHEESAENAELVSIEYAAGTWMPWSLRPGATQVLLPDSETASIDVDSTGRIWLATESGNEVRVHYSDDGNNYGSFMGPIILESGINADDITAVAAMPNGTVGVMWSNQNDSRFGFKVHVDVDNPDLWSLDEVPSSPSAGNGFADDHINLAVASDGTLYASIKTSYDSSNEPTIGLLVRRPNGTWDDLYVVDSGNGTRGIVQINEITSTIRVVYKTDANNDKNIVYRDSPMAPIAFGPEQLLMAGLLNNPTSTKQNWTDELVVLASGDGDPLEATGVVFVTDTTPVTGACCLGDGTCTPDITAADCVAVGGVFQGQGVLCDDADCDVSGACCFTDGSCSPVIVADCDALGGTYQGAGTDCTGDPCNTDIVNLATGDFATTRGTIIAGSYFDTFAQDDVAEAIQEEQSNGPLNKRRSLLEHVWTFDVAAGTGYTFFVNAWHTDNSENDHFVFSYSLDDSSYTAMLTVTAVADDDTLQGYVFPEDVSGTVFVRVEDTDRTRGLYVEDTLFVDEMFIVTTIGVDVDPPAPPTGLVATGGDSVVLLDWDDNGEPDLGGYHVYRSENGGVDYTSLTAQPLTASSYTDASVSNGTTYDYIVTAVDTTGNESGDSLPATVTPDVGSGATMHVDSIVVTVVGVGGGDKIGRAVVVIVDSFGIPVEAATVTGSFTGDIEETVVGLTDAAGSVTLDTTGTARKSVQLLFCVDGVTHASPSLLYDPGANQETCDVN